ncbi:MAG: hypothetical protein HYT15_03730 [Candidatus Magasanikbacteria bacterium]|nr:hypothetical protein [Candidatus Magasanikbacteria bacterium]
MKSVFRTLAHLQEQLGEQCFAELLSSDNTRAVRKFAIKLALAKLPTEITLGRRRYEVLSFHKPGEEEYVDSDTMVSRTAEMNASLDAKERRYILKHQADFPPECRIVSFFFTNDFRLGSAPAWSKERPKQMCSIGWSYGSDSWLESWQPLEGRVYDVNCQVLRPKM